MTETETRGGQRRQDAGEPPTLSTVIAATEDLEPPADAPLEGKCVICGYEGLSFPITDSNGTFSDAFDSDQLLADGDGVCWRCDEIAGMMDYRRYHWVATESDGVRVVKERPELLDVLLDPPDEPWMAKYKDGSDFLPVLNGWLAAQTLNTSSDQYRLLVDKELVDVDRERFAAMVEFGQELRGREDESVKRVLKGHVNPSDYQRYDVTRADVDRIREEYAGDDLWRIAVQLIQ